MSEHEVKGRSTMLEGIKKPETINHPISVIKRFWIYTAKERENGCWEWIGSYAKRGGYGQLNDRGKLLKAHRISYEIHKGEIPKGLFVCHRCGNTKCVNPDHLYAGTCKQNSEDSRIHGTLFIPIGARGEKHHDAKLTIKDVKYIKKSTDRGVDLAKKFNVSVSAISCIKRGKSWKNVMI